MREGKEGAREHCDKRHQNNDARSLELDMYGETPLIGVLLTGPTRSMMTSRTSNHPSSDNTSNSANMALPMLSKLKLRGFAL